MVYLLLKQLPLLTRYPMDHVKVGIYAPSVATRITIYLVVTIIRGRSVWLVYLFIMRFEPVLVI